MYITDVHVVHTTKRASDVMHVARVTSYISSQGEEKVGVFSTTTATTSTTNTTATTSTTTITISSGHISNEGLYTDCILTVY